VPVQPSVPNSKHRSPYSVNQNVHTKKPVILLENKPCYESRYPFSHHILSTLAMFCQNLRAFGDGIVDASCTRGSKAGRILCDGGSGRLSQCYWRVIEFFGDSTAKTRRDHMANAKKDTWEENRLERNCSVRQFCHTIIFVQGGCRLTIDGCWLVRRTSLRSASIHAKVNVRRGG